MKAFKLFAMLLIAASFSFTLSSCGDDDEVTPQDVLNGDADLKVGISDLKDSGSELSWTYVVGVVGTNYKVSTTEYYGYDSNKKIISHKEEINCPSKEYAEIEKQVYAENSYVESTKLDGKTLTIIYKASDFEGLTVDDVKTIYEKTKEIIK